jgi:hypothetical protein
MEDPKLLYASAATGFARQGAREEQIHAALEGTSCLYLSLSHSLLAGRRPAAADAAVRQPAGALGASRYVRGAVFLRIFGSSNLRRGRGPVQRDK